MRKSCTLEPYLDRKKVVRLLSSRTARVAVSEPIASGHQCFATRIHRPPFPRFTPSRCPITQPTRCTLRLGRHMTSYQPVLAQPPGNPEIHMTTMLIRLFRWSTEVTSTITCSLLVSSIRPTHSPDSSLYVLVSNGPRTVTRNPVWISNQTTILSSSLPSGVRSLDC